MAAEGTGRETQQKAGNVFVGADGRRPVRRQPGGFCHEMSIWFVVVHVDMTAPVVTLLPLYFVQDK